MERITRIDVVLKEKDMLMKELAEMLGMPANSLYRICRNEVQPSLVKLKAIALALDVDVRELLIPTKSDKHP